ncbi:MAG: hypothetical protein ACK411_10140 [Exiguobacterium mexicanum]
MKKTVVALIMSVSLLQGCSSDSEPEMIQWGEYTTSQESRLTKNGIKFEVKNDYIYIDQKDVKKASSCCT